METPDEHLKSVFASLGLEFSNMGKITSEVVLMTAGKLLSDLGIASLLLVEMDRFPLESSRTVIAVSVRSCFPYFFLVT